MYSILIKVDGIERRKKSASFLHLIAGVFLITKATDYYRLTNYMSLVPIIPVFIAAFISLLYGFFKRRLDPTSKYNQLIRFLQTVTFAVMGFLMIHNGRAIDYIGSFLWAALCLLHFFTERKIFNDSNLLIDEHGLTIPGYYSNHHITWNSLSDCVVRQDFVTIFHKRNKYLQYQVMQSLSDLEIACINSFCQERLGLTKTNDINNYSKL